MDTIHSEGNWVINREQEDCGEDKLSVETEDGYFIAQVDPGHSQEANAKLITAAPDLLAVLTKIRGYHVNHHVLHEIDAAITKATGEAPKDDEAKA